ncbi:DUF2510 domain-containing protein [Pseudactinotalea sp.]|uniref:DUF2510 domain-containing protein n=1 Tax=Pseudactinotalea sp. TaxID=1926260 RepID=UPI003B3BE179
MSEPTSRAPGYYPDPASNNRIRYWNGSGWGDQHENVTAPTSLSGSGTPPSGPYGTAPSAPYGTPPSAPYGTPPAQAPNTTYPGALPAPGRGRGPRVGGVLGLVVLLALGGLVWGLVRNAGRPPEPSGEVQVGTPLVGDVPSRGSWASALTIAEAGVYWLTATADEDLTMAVYDHDSRLAENDDGRPSVFQIDSLDPVLMLYLEPGEYIVAVETYHAEAADAELRVSGVAAVEVGADPVAVTTSSEEPWIGYTAPDPGSIGIDVHAQVDGDDLQLYAWAGDDALSNDDRADGDPPGGEYDPYLEISRPGGRVVFMVVPWGSSDTEHEATVSVSRT